MIRRALLLLFLVPACNAAREEPVPSFKTDIVRPASVARHDAVDEKTIAALGLSRDRIASSPVPVLAPRLAVTSPVLLVEDEWYVINAKANGATVHVQGTRAAHRYDSIAPIAGNRALRAGKGFVTVNENVHSASFIEGGVAYSVDVECSESTDTRCQGDDFIVSVVNDLAYVGGAGR